jgi:signal transduction histidine kinase
MSFHKTLQNQIRKFLPEDMQENEALKPFLESVSRHYLTIEKDKNITEHAFEISEREYREVMQTLKKELEIKRESIMLIKQAIWALMGDSPRDLNIASDDLFDVINFLELQITRTKQLETSLLEAKNMAEKAARAKSEFLSVMSHEIRTPLNAIIGNVHLLQEEEQLPGQKDYLQSLQIASSNLLNLINDILDYGKIDEGKVEFVSRDFDVRQVIDNIRRANLFKANERENRLKVLFDEDVPQFVKGDETRLGQVLNNLVANAIKFTQKGNVDITIRLEKEKTDEVGIHFEVKDTGIGIKPELQKTIFERFTQANSDITRQYGGSGLGLTITKRLLQLMGSEIFLESEEGKGSRFYFTLYFPKSERVEKQEEIVPRTLKDLSGMNVLLVEDVKMNVIMAKKILEKWNALVDTAENGEIAVQMVREKVYEVILMDLQMPVMDGFTATKEIRAFNTEIPVIALTASASLETQQEVYKAGMNGYVSKPFNPVDLYEVLARIRQ